MLDSSHQSLKYTDELISCNLETGQWQHEPVEPVLDEEKEPLPVLKRDFHSAVYTNGRIVVFGGKCEYILSYFVLLCVSVRLFSK